MEFEIDAQERDVLVRLVEQALGDTRVERSKTAMGAPHDPQPAPIDLAAQ
jgi:hypothetical protein